MKEQCFIVTGKNNLRHRFSRYLLDGRKFEVNENVVTAASLKFPLEAKENLHIVQYAQDGLLMPVI